MAVSAHLETLQSKHTHLEEKIQAELRSPLPVANIPKRGNRYC